MVEDNWADITSMADVGQEVQLNMQTKQIRFRTKSMRPNGNDVYGPWQYRNGHKQESDHNLDS